MPHLLDCGCKYTEFFYICKQSSKFFIHFRACFEIIISLLVKEETLPTIKKSRVYGCATYFSALFFAIRFIFRNLAPKCEILIF